MLGLIIGFLIATFIVSTIGAALLAYGIGVDEGSSTVGGLAILAVGIIMAIASLCALGENFDDSCVHLQPTSGEAIDATT